ncbi:MAG: GspE/PulE family protein [Phycisphaerales bacterium]|jgi:general secretion pathway protein E/type IV pilus assembly protein PilB|nr:GspE/PulE family protein [Phycisphaerales bacterium]MDP6311945.1 GspE/PulE family protein [Phycisphaerales bacterium]MDP7088079.1 GspE/PulE family protein [Phycisphaerales bacterium]MDP7188717.1 GspE/PulE family protein [Phycisphaerales bacterium]HJN79330.1 GspE/PulE family protein [Phycisphaerales bacterium]|tara:strand:- start:1187 stop:2854 length:1668 start_codon:yes stop_codon:yes gene_type:complete
MGIDALLLERGLVSAAEVEEAVAEQQRTGERLDRVLVRLGHVDSQSMLHAIGEQFSMPIVDLATVVPEPEILKLLPSRLVFRQHCVPIDRADDVLRVATSDPFELTAFDELRLLTGLSIELVLADEEDLRNFIRRHYGVAGDTLEALHAEVEPVVTEAATDEADQAELASVIRLVNDLLVEAIRERATDLHIEPYEDRVAIRYRVDGILTTASVPRTVDRFRAAIISRLKIMANLNVAERRRPQDGRISMRHDGHLFDLRVSVIPMMHGEGVVLRILDSTAGLRPLDELGMQENVLTRWDECIHTPHGILLVTGPTGSGKSTTLYASLRRVVTGEVKAITIEDPVEYHLDGVNQIQTQAEVGMTFAAGLRSILRHDPDIVMVGEIRDRETAEAAVQASLTGHLVFSTLHTNTAAGAMPRLLDMGVEPFLVASSVEAVLAQRLVRRVCASCGADWTPDWDTLPDALRFREGTVLRRGTGCRDCRGTGYHGRVGLYELLVVSDSVRKQVLAQRSTGEIAQAAVGDKNLTTLLDAGRTAVLQGLTCPDEVARVAVAGQ